MDFYKWFFLEEGRSAEGLFSFAHLASVTIALGIFLFFAIFVVVVWLVGWFCFC